MPQYKYRVIPAPNRGVKAKGIKTPEDRFSHALEELMNRMAAEGWEYQRAEALPSVERSGLTSTTTNWRNVLVFRKAAEEPAALLTAPSDTEAEKPASVPAEDGVADAAADGEKSEPASDDPPTPEKLSATLTPEKSSA